jgi:hypothetical protein
MDLVATCGGGWEGAGVGPAAPTEAAKQSTAAGTLRDNIISSSSVNN